MSRIPSNSNVKGWNRLSVRIIFIVILCSVLLTLLTTAFQLYFDYQKDVKSIHTNILFIEESYLPAIAFSVYTLDMQQVKILLEGTLNIIDIEYIEIDDTSNNIFSSAGNPKASRDVTNAIPLNFTTISGKNISLGTLKVSASFEGIYKRLIEKAYLNLLSNIVRMFVAAIIFLAIINSIIIRHLKRISNFTQDLDLNELDTELSLNRKTSKSDKYDELDQLVSSLNSMQSRIRTDILKQKKTAEELLVSKNKYQKIYDNSPDMYVSVSPDDASIIMCNQTLLQKTGYSKDEIIGSSIFKMYHEDCMDEVKKTFQHFVKTGKIHDKELILKRKDGSKIYVNLNVDAVRDDTGRIVHSISAWRDVTESKQADEALKLNEKKLSDLFNNLDAGIVIHAADTSIIRSNPKASELLGLSKEQMSGKEAIDQEWKFLNENKQPMPIGEYPVNKILSSKKVLKNYVVGVVQPESEDLVWLHVNGFPVLDNSNEIIEIIISFIDFTERKLSEDEIINNSEILMKQVETSEKQRIANLVILNDLNKTTRNLRSEISVRKEAEEEINKNLKEKSTLLQELYHRTKNNMQVISSMLKMQTRRTDNDFVKSTFRDINNKIKAMSLVHQKLYQAKDLSSINLKEYIEDILDLLIQSYNIRSSRISLKLDLKDVRVLVDSAIPLGLVLNELISNIFKHAFPENMKGVITIRLYQEKDGTIQIHVGDNGVGIPVGMNVITKDSIGLQTVFSLIQYQMKGQYRFDMENGLKWQIRFKDDQHKRRV